MKVESSVFCCSSSFLLSFLLGTNILIGITRAQTCTDDRPTSNALGVQLSFYSNSGGGNLGDTCPDACTSPMTSAYYPVDTLTGGQCYMWPGGSGQNSGKNGVCDTANNKYTWDQWTNCDCSGTVGNTKDAFTDKCVVDNPNTLCVMITDYTACSSSPTTPGATSPAPSVAPTAAPTAAPTCTCFSESTTVEVVNNNNNNMETVESDTATTTVTMKDLQVGDEIFAGLGDDNKPIYETVYGFAHRDVERVADYLQITTSTATGAGATTTTLEISSNHLVFLQGRRDPVPAGLLVVGDILIKQHASFSAGTVKATAAVAMKPAKIVDIQTIKSRGLYAPLTKDGTVIVDGIHASSYVSISHMAPRVIGATRHFISEQMFFHWWMAPYRIFCTHVAPDMCIDDYSKEDGYIHWLVLGKKLAEIAEGWCSLLMAAGLSVVLLICAAFVLLETLFERPLFWVLRVACGFFLWRRFSFFASKQHKNADTTY